MYEKLLYKNDVPTMDEFIAHIGKAKDLFENIDAFLIDEISSEKAIKLDAHSRCWSAGYHKKRKFICDIHAEKDAFTIITRLSEESIAKIYDDLAPYAKERVDNSPFRHRGWIEYRIVDFEHLENAKLILQVRAEYK